MMAVPIRRTVQAVTLALFWQIPALANEPGPWLGIALEPVPSPLAQQLSIDPGGLMIANIVRDSPADKAGLRQYDVVLEADGQAVPDEPAEFIRIVRGKRPGDGLKLTVIHAGERRTVDIILAPEPENLRELPWTHPEAQGWPHPSPDLRGKILRRGPHGWVWDDLGPVPPAHMPDRLRSYVENLLPGEHEATMLRRVDKDGSVLQIRVEKDGSVEVKRYADRDGERQAEIQKFANIEELQTRDPEAFAFYQSLHSDRSPEAPIPPPPAATPPDGRNWAEGHHGRMREWQENLGRYQDDLKRWQQEVQKHLGDKDWENNWREWSQRFFQGPLQQLQPAVPLTPPTSQPTPETQFRFQAHSDGSISATYRDQDAELTRTFTSEAEMKANAPDLYARFKTLNEHLLR